MQENRRSMVPENEYVYEVVENDSGNESDDFGG